LKKKTIIRLLIVIACLVLITAFGFIHFRPIPIISSPYTVIEANSDGFYTIRSKTEVFVTEVEFCTSRYNVDNMDKEKKEKLVEILSKVKCRRSLNDYSYPHSSERTAWNIHLVQDFKRIQITIGKYNNRVHFDFGRKSGAYWIIDQESLVDALNELL